MSTFTLFNQFSFLAKVRTHTQELQAFSYLIKIHYIHMATKAYPHLHFVPEILQSISVIPPSKSQNIPVELQLWKALVTDYLKRDVLTPELTQANANGPAIWPVGLVHFHPRNSNFSNIIRSISEISQSKFTRQCRPVIEERKLTPSYKSLFIIPLKTKHYNDHQ